MEYPIEPPAIRSLKLLILVALLLPAPLLGYAAWKSYNGLVSVADERTRHTVNVLQEHSLKVLRTAEGAISETNAVLRGLSDDDIRAREEELHNRLKEIARPLEEVSAISVLARDGRPLLSSMSYPTRTDRNNSDREYFTAHSQGKPSGTFVSEVMRSRSRDMNIFVVSQARPSLDGAFNGVVSLAIQPEGLNQFYAKVAAGTGMSANLVRQDGAVIARYPEQANPARRLGPESAFAKAIATAPEGTYSTVSPLDAVERNVTYRKLPNYPLYVASGFERRVIWQDLRSQMADYLLFGLPMMLLLILASSLALSRTRAFLGEFQRRETAENALKQAQRLEAIGQMTGGIAHDFNNILLVVQGNAERLQRHLTEPRQLKSVGAILQAAALGERLTRQLLSFSRRQTVAPTDIDLSEQVPRLREILEASLRGDIELRLDFPASLWPVKADATELELALINLAVNARDAMPNGGHLSVRGENVVLGGANTPDGLAGMFVALAVSDTGGGIPPDVLPRIFDPFFTTKEVGRGTGLGLSQVYGFSRQAGGTAQAVSRAGDGATITLYLPRGEAVPKQAPAEIVRAGPSALAGAAILLVEDNPSVAEMTSAGLVDLGCKVAHMPTADAAAEALRRNGMPYDLILSDVVMPGAMSGIDLARWLRQRNPETPVVLATGYSKAAQEARDEGFLIMAKPYQFAALEAVLVDVLARKVRVSTGPLPEDAAGSRSA